MDRTERIMKIKEMCSTAGWKLKRQEIEESIEHDCSELVNLMTRSPEKVTGRNAFRLGMRIKANREFLEGIDNDCKI